MIRKNILWPLAPYRTLSAWLDWDYLESLGWDGPPDAEACLQVGTCPSHQGCFGLGHGTDFSGRLRPRPPSEEGCWKLPFLLWAAERGPEALTHVIGMAKSKSISLPLNHVFSAPKGSPYASSWNHSTREKVGNGWTLLEMLVGLLPYPSRSDSVFFVQENVEVRERILDSMGLLLDAGASLTPSLVGISAIHGLGLWAVFAARGLAWKDSPCLIDVAAVLGLTRDTPRECLDYLLSKGMVPTDDFLLRALKGHPSCLGAHDFDRDYLDALVKAGLDFDASGVSGNVWVHVAENAFWSRDNPEKRAQHLASILEKVEWLETRGFKESINELVRGSRSHGQEFLSPLSFLCKPVWGGSIDSLGLHPELIEKFLELGAKPGLRGEKEGGGRLPVEWIEGNREDSISARLVLMSTTDMEKLSTLPAAPSPSRIRRI